MVVCFDYALSRRVSKSLADFLDMRLFDMLEMFLFENVPHRLTDVLRINGEEYAIKKMRGILKTEMDCSGAVFVSEPKMLGLNQDLFEDLRSRNLVVYLKRDYKTEFAIRERMSFKSPDDKSFFKLEIDEMTELGMNIENNFADIVVDINDLTFDQIKQKIQNSPDAEPLLN